MRVSDLRYKLTQIWQQFGDIEIVVHNNGSIGDINIILEPESLIVKNNVLYIE